MSLNIDIAIFVAFLAVNLAVGLWYGKGIKTIKEYAIGNRDFSTGTIAATIVATWIAGSAFLTDVSETYTDGLFYMVPGMLGDIISWIIICYFLAPRMGEFLGSLSIADAMGNLYGNKVRFITAIASAFNCVGKVAAQFKVSATILQLFFGISNLYATLVSCIIVVIYSTFGGIRAVTFTDIIQFITFGAIIPIITLIIWGTFSDPEVVFYTIKENPLFDYRELVNTSNPKFWGAFTLAIYFLIPSLNPAIFQRIAMARDTNQVSSSFFLATFTRLVISLLFFWVGILLLSHNSQLDPNNLFAYIIDNYAYTGFKGIVAAGVMAMAMSTADSYINAATVTFAYDIRKSFEIEWSERKSLIVSYASAILFSLLAFILAFYVKGLLSLFLLVGSFYLPIVTVPFLFAVFGFRSSYKSVLTGMAAAFISVLIWRNYFAETGVNSAIPGVITNIIFLLLSHYLLKQPGGWVGIQNTTPLHKARTERKRSVNDLINKIREFKVYEFLSSNTPKTENIYSLFAFFSIVSVFSTMYSLHYELRQQYNGLIAVIYHSVLISSSILLSYPVWPSRFKNEKFITVAWNLALPYILVFVPTVLVIVSNFGQLQLMIFMINLLIISVLLRWQVALFMVILGVFIGIQFFSYQVGLNEILDSSVGSTKFKIIYTLLLFSSTLIIFFKPKQEQYALSEEKNEHLHGRITAQEEEVRSALKLKSEFIRNIEHEYHTPMTGITSMAQVLFESYGALNDEQRQEAAKSIFQSSLRLEQFDKNINSLATLSKAGYELNLEPVDLSSLVEERVKTCRKLYETDSENREFICNIEGNIKTNVDKRYLVQALDNLIINAITYCQKGRITITLSKNNEGIMFSIEDEGIGIPSRELDEIFLEFTVSSRTKTPAGGRGVGLALCKRVIEVHGGKIWAESDGFKGATFTFVLNK